ncbi:MAG: AI-2E family transporter [Bryobacterales bacterium]|nr:AI-2E family transporter [Bryobacterales bacterium]
MSGSAQASNGNGWKALAVRREALAWLLAAVLGYLVYRVVSPFLESLVWAGILATFFYPAHRRVKVWLRKPSLAALVSTAAVALLLIAPTFWLGWTFVTQAVDAVRDIPRAQVAEKIRTGMDFVSARVPESFGSVEERVGEWAQGLSEKLLALTAKLPANIAGFILGFVVLLLTLFYLFRDGPKLVRLLRDISPFEGDRHDVMVKQTIDMITVTINAGFVVAFAQGLLGGLSFMLVGLGSPILWGVVMAIASFIPILGAWMVWLPAAIGLLAAGEVGRGIALLALGGLLISSVDNVLRPILIADRSQLNALLVFISVLGGVGAFGFVGIILGPLVLATAAGLITGYRETLADGSSGEEDAV